VEGWSAATEIAALASKYGSRTMSFDPAQGRPLSFQFLNF
jgi:hypothetical protein